MKSMKNKLRSQLSDSNVLVTVTNLTTNVTDLLIEKQYQVSLRLIMFVSPVRGIIFI